MSKLKGLGKSALLMILLASSLLMLPGSAALAAQAKSAQTKSSSTGSSGASHQTITEAFAANSPLQQGMIVGTDPKNRNEVEPLSSDRIESMQGVVVPASAAPVTISNASAQNQVFVASLGRYNVLVSDQNGPIETGDYITISALAGIGMKASTGGELVVGKAAGSFDGSSGALSKTTLHGNGQQVSIGLVSVDLGIVHSPLGASSNQIFGFTFLEQVAQTLTGKVVNPPRIYASLAIFIVIALIAAAILYAGIRGDMIATGRNPLAKTAISRNLFEVVIVAVVVFIIGLGAIYLILKL